MSPPATPEELQANPGTLAPAAIYRVDLDGVITAASGFPDAETFIGRPLRSVMSANGVMNLCHLLTQRVRQGVALSYRFRCDAPGEKRWFMLEARCLESGEVEFKSTLLSAEQRPKVAWLELPARYGAHAPLVAMCSWCGAVRREDGTDWDPLEVALETDSRIGPEQRPRLTHGICPACEETLRGQIAALR